LEDFKTKIELLRSIKLDVPKDIHDVDPGTKVDLLGLMYNNRDLLVNGMSSHAKMSTVENFMYFNVLPKLQLHDLAVSEPVPGTSFRRISLSEEGRRLVATMEYEFQNAKYYPQSLPEVTDAAAVPQQLNLPTAESQNAAVTVKAKDSVSSPAPARRAVSKSRKKSGV
jgi:hypothetical protein